MALLAILGAISAKMLSNANKGQAAVQNSVDFDVLITSLTNVVLKTDLCGVALRSNVGVAKFHPTNTIDSDEQLSSIAIGTTSIATLGQNLGGGLSISDLKLQHISGTGPEYFVELIVEVTKNGVANYGGAKLSNQSNPLRFSINTNASSEIISCGVSSPSATCAWSARRHHNDDQDNVCSDVLPNSFMAGFDCMKHRDYCRFNRIYCCQFN